MKSPGRKKARKRSIGRPTLDDRAILLGMAELRAAIPGIKITEAARRLLDGRYGHSAESTERRLLRKYSERVEYFDNLGRQRWMEKVQKTGWIKFPFIRRFPILPTGTLLSGPLWEQKRDIVKKDAEDVKAVMRTIETFGNWACESSDPETLRSRVHHLVDQLRTAADFLADKTREKQDI